MGRGRAGERLWLVDTPAPARSAPQSSCRCCCTAGSGVSELTDVDVELGHSRGHRVLHVHGKGDAEREVVLPPPATRRLDPYLVAAPIWPVARVPALPGQPGTSRPWSLQRPAVEWIAARSGGCYAASPAAAASRWT